MTNMAGVVDADTHIIEHEGIWDLLEPEMYARRPVLMGIPNDTLYKESSGLWLIDGAIFPKPAGKGSWARNSSATTGCLSRARPMRTCHIC